MRSFRVNYLDDNLVKNLYVYGEFPVVRRSPFPTIPLFWHLKNYPKNICLLPGYNCISRTSNIIYYQRPHRNIKSSYIYTYLWL